MIAQTYSKLTLLTYFTFNLGSNRWEWRYYNIFKEFLGEANESLLRLIFSDKTVDENQRYVCGAGFTKLCFLSVEDNFIPSNFLSFIIFIIELLFLALIVLILQLLKKQKLKKILFHKVKCVMFYAFLFEKNLEFLFTLLLNAHILIFSILSLSIFKIIGLAILILYLFCISYILWANDKKQRIPLPPARQIKQQWLLC